MYKLSSKDVCKNYIYLFLVNIVADMQFYSYKFLFVFQFTTRTYSIARLYYEVGDYGSCQKYVEQYLTQKSNNAAAHKLLGQAFQKLGEKEKALEQYKTSFDIDPTQTSTILDGI